jgi:hypothetical protein
MQRRKIKNKPTNRPIFLTPIFFKKSSSLDSSILEPFNLNMAGNSTMVGSGSSSSSKRS